MGEPLAAIHSGLRRLGGYRGLYVPEFTWNGCRIDAIVIDLRTRWVRGFEIKLSREDFRRDEKWTRYSQFCSSLSIVSPEGVVPVDDVEKPFGLLWLKQDGTMRWAKKPMRFQHRSSLAWVWTYMQVLEYELPRLEAQNQALQNEVRWLKEDADKRHLLSRVVAQ